MGLASVSSCCRSDTRDLFNQMRPGRFVTLLDTLSTPSTLFTMRELGVAYIAKIERLYLPILEASYQSLSAQRLQFLVAFAH